MKAGLMFFDETLHKMFYVQGADTSERTRSRWRQDVAVPRHAGAELRGPCLATGNMGSPQWKMEAFGTQSSERSLQSNLTTMLM